MDKTQLGRAGELAMALYSIVSSDGELQLFTPVADDDHVDRALGLALNFRTPHFRSPHAGSQRTRAKESS